MTPLTFVVPGPLDQLTGGYRFDHRLVTGLREQGRAVSVIELPGRFPQADRIALEASAQALQSQIDGALVVIDGLALPGFAGSLQQHSQRLRIVCFVHHPLSAETGLPAEEARAMAALEMRLWGLLRGVVCPSEDSASRVRAAGLHADRVATAPPGTDPVPNAWRASRAGTDTVSLLSVGTITRRKGHHLLVEALARLRELPWKLTCVGSLDRDPVCTRELQSLIAHHDLSSRIHLTGECSDEQLRQAYAEADAFVLPSYHEGYGMVFAEAMAWGLPIVATRGGAIPQTVPAHAGLLIEPGDVEALTRQLRRLISEPDLRNTLASGSRQAGAALRTWPQAVHHWITEVERLAA